HEASDGQYLVRGTECPVDKRRPSDVLARSRQTLKNVKLRFPDEPAGEDRGICRGKDRHTSVLRHQVGHVREYRRIEHPRWPEFPSCTPSPCRERQATSSVGRHSKTPSHDGCHYRNRKDEAD